MPAPLDPTATYTADEAAAILGVTRRTLSNWRSQQRGPAYCKHRPGCNGRVLFLGSDILDWLRERRVATAEAG